MITFIVRMCCEMRKAEYAWDGSMHVRLLSKALPLKDFYYYDLFATATLVH